MPDEPTQSNEQPDEEAEEDAKFLKSLRQWAAAGNCIPSLNPDGWTRLCRALDAEKKAS
jgi:hypothetical protein